MFVWKTHSNRYVEITMIRNSRLYQIPQGNHIQCVCVSHRRFLLKTSEWESYCNDPFKVQYILRCIYIMRLIIFSWVLVLVRGTRTLRYFFTATFALSAFTQPWRIWAHEPQLSTTRKQNTRTVCIVHGTYLHKCITKFHFHSSSL